MYAIIDWMSCDLVYDLKKDETKTWETKEKAENFAKEQMHTGLYSIVEVPDFALPYL
jgi:hypothetical protein